MPQSYYLVRAKLARADQHLNALQASIEGFINSNPYRPIADVDVEAGDSLIRIKVTREPPVLDWGVAIGDVLHNLRSGLDHLVWHLGGDPPPNEDDSEFPIFIDRSNYRRNGIKKVVGVPDYPQAIIEDLQPYHRGDTAHLDPLWQLHRLSNFDKHRLLHVSGAVIQGASYWVEAPAGRRRTSTPSGLARLKTAQ